MSIQPELTRSILAAFNYSLLFDYPLTAEELRHWLPCSASRKQVDRRLSLLIKQKKLTKKGNLYCLAGVDRDFLHQRRLCRQSISRRKWQIAFAAGRKLSRLQTIEAIAVTGSLAMSNCDEDADIDLMFICLPNTLWLTRLAVWLLLFPNRRSPLATNTRQIRDKVCDNVYLESNRLQFDSGSLSTTRSFYLAHEILQAKPIYERRKACLHFLRQNQWVGEIFPNIRRPRRSLSPISTLPVGKLSRLLALPNFFAFILQYLFMRPKITGETITLHRALFHPRLPSAINRFRWSPAN